MTGWQQGWVLFGLFFVILESAALVRSYRARQRGEPDRFTLSSQLWALGGTAKGAASTGWAWVRRGLLAAALLWLAVHLLSGGQII